jgi:hypothetical protein
LSVDLGFTVPDGIKYAIPLQHVVVTGITQQGKTTTVEAILHRLPESYKSLVFITKRGEKTFLNGDVHSCPPFYRERFDWEYVRSLLEATWHERMKFETPWIITICKVAATNLKTRGVDLAHMLPGEGLREVRRCLTEYKTKEKLREFDKNIYTLLEAYMDKVLVGLDVSKIKFSDHLQLQQGINVMDLTDWYTHEEVQMLVIRACMDEILRGGHKTVIALPEAWKMLPQERNTPVKLVFEKYVREGATNQNYLLVDVQDLGGMDKTHLRQVDVWIMGRMQESNEVDRLLKQTLGLNIKPKEIQTLPLGHFMVAARDSVTKVYVWPWGISEDLARRVAKHENDWTPEIVKEILKGSRTADLRVPQHVELQDLKEETNIVLQDLKNRLDAQSKRIDSLEERLDKMPTQNLNIGSLTSDKVELGSLTQVQKRITVVPQTLEFKMTTETPEGRVMCIAKDGFLKGWKPQVEIEAELTQHGWFTGPQDRIKYSKALDNLVKQDFLGKRRTNRAEYKLADFVEFEETRALTQQEKGIERQNKNE